MNPPNFMEKVRPGQFYLKTGHPPGDPDGITYYAFTDNRAVALLYREVSRESVIYGFVYEITSREEGIIPFPFSSHVPIKITFQKNEEGYVSLEGMVDSARGISEHVRSIDGRKFEFKVKVW